MMFEIFRSQPIERMLQIAVGGYYLFWGFNGFFHWLKPPPSSRRMQNFIEALDSTRFLLGWVKILEVLCGGLLLMGWKVPLALLVIGPIVLIICLSHLFLNLKKGWSVVLIVALPYLILWSFHWNFLLDLWVSA